MELTEDQIKHLLQGISVPPQPQIMVDLQMEQLAPDCSMSRIAKLISQDVGLAGSILKTVNSSFFALSNKIASIDQAINLLGLKTVVNIVNALSIRGELTDEAIVTLGRFWDTATDIAMTCATIAKQIGHPAPDEAYTLGLFHNCGIPLMMQRFSHYPEIVEKSYACRDARIIDEENKELTTNHAVVGYYVAKSWNLPMYVCEAIADHHSARKIFENPDYANTQKKNLLAILKMAEHICRTPKVLANQDEDYEWDALEDNILIYVGLSHYDFGNMKEAINEMGIGVGGFIDL